MPQLKLTKTNIDRVAKPGGKADVLYWDKDTKGFGLRVTPTGLAKFIAQGRVRGTTTDVRITVGSYGAWTVDEARRKADEYRHQFEQGVDPREVARQQKALGVTLQEVCDAYVGRPGKLRASTADEIKRHVAKVFATWCDKPIASITRDMVRDRHAELVEKGLNGKKGAPASANAAMVTLRILINFATDEYRRPDGRPLIEHNPVGALKHHWAKLGSRTERYVDKGKLGAVWNRLQEDRADPRSRDALAGIDLTIFLLLTGARRDEGAALTWDRVHLADDAAECSWHLDERKRGDPITLPLSSQAAALLRARLPKPKVNDDDPEPSPFVFPSWSKAGRIMDARSAMETVSEVVGKHLSLHDLRRTFTNIAMRECRIEKFRTDLLTGHKPAQEDTTSRNYLDLTNLGWARWLEWAYQVTTVGFPTEVVLAPEAQHLFEAEVRQLRQLVISTEEFSPAYAAHLGKHPGMLAEVALTFHVFCTAAGCPPATQVGAEAMTYAIRYLRKARRHAHTLYSSILSSAPAFELARALARSVVASEEPVTTISRDWMTQHCQAFKKADDRLRREAVQILEDADWLCAQTHVRTYGGWPSRYAVHHRVAELFAREGEQWRARRAAVRDAIGEVG